MLTKDVLEEMKQKISDPEIASTLDPWTHQFYNAFLNSYGYNEDGNEKSFNRRYTNYYAPFYKGAASAKLSDLIPNSYKRSTPWNSDAEVRAKYRYNKKIDKMSNSDPFITAGAHGLGLMAAGLGGGIPSFVGGLGIKYGIPLIWDSVKRKLAKKYAKKKYEKEKDHPYDTVYDRAYGRTEIPRTLY